MPLAELGVPLTHSARPLVTYPVVLLNDVDEVQGLRWPRPRSPLGHDPYARLRIAREVRRTTGAPLTCVEVAHSPLALPGTVDAQRFLGIDIRFRRRRELVCEQRALALELPRDTLVPIKKR